MKSESCNSSGTYIECAASKLRVPLKHTMSKTRRLLIFLLFVLRGLMELLKPKSSRIYIDRATPKHWVQLKKKYFFVLRFWMQLRNDKTPGSYVECAAPKSRVRLKRTMSKTRRLRLLWYLFYVSGWSYEIQNLPVHTLNAQHRNIGFSWRIFSLFYVTRCYRQVVIPQVHTLSAQRRTSGLKSNYVFVLRKQVKSKRPNCLVSWTSREAKSF